MTTKGTGGGFDFPSWVDRSVTQDHQETLTTAALGELRLAARRLPQWSPHPDIRHLVPSDPEWGPVTVALADVERLLTAGDKAEAPR